MTAEAKRGQPARAWRDHVRRRRASDEKEARLVCGAETDRQEEDTVEFTGPAGDRDPPASGSIGLRAR